ncbi:hypothetical protein IW138_002665 [Coemansia sp. RSA 986]|nr:hypothetical protein IW138_002665 [Coemansia sp. RSA 986]
MTGNNLSDRNSQGNAQPSFESFDKGDDGRQDIFDTSLPFSRQLNAQTLILRNGTVWEPPYAHLLRQLGLFDPIVIPRQRIGRHDSTFPVVVHSAKALQRPIDQRAGNDNPWSQERDSIADGARHDIRSIIDPISETFGETTRWALGSLFGQMRNAMDYVESTIQRRGEQQHEDNKQQAQESNDLSPSFFRVIRSDLISNFDKVFPEAGENIRSSYCQISSRTLPDGSIETRKVVRGNDGTKQTTVTRHYLDSSKHDETNG